MPSSCEVQQSGKNCPQIVKIYTVGQVTHEQLQCTAGRVPNIWLQDEASQVSRVFNFKPRVRCENLLFSHLHQ